MRKSAYKDINKYYDAKRKYNNQFRKDTGCGTAENRCKRWTEEEDSLVLAHDITDRELYHLIGRSVKAIQHRRHYLHEIGFV